MLAKASGCCASPLPATFGGFGVALRLLIWFLCLVFGIFLFAAKFGSAASRQLGSAFSTPLNGLGLFTGSVATIGTFVLAGATRGWPLPVMGLPWGSPTALISICLVFLPPAHRVAAGRSRVG